MPTDARRHVIAVEKAVHNALQDTSGAYEDAATYIARLPEWSGEFRVDQLRPTFLDYAAMLEPLRGAERAFVIDRSIQCVLEIGFLLGDLAYDSRR